MSTKYSAKDKFTAKESDFVIVSMPKKQPEPKKASKGKTEKPVKK